VVTNGKRTRWKASTGKGNNRYEMIVTREILSKTKKDLLRGGGGVVEAGWHSKFGVEKSMNSGWWEGYKWMVLWVAKRDKKKKKKRQEKRHKN
jgi:hypothetical protein